MSTPKVVVMTPVKNEAWILDRFLAVTSQLADHIVVADQNSSDESVAICRQYPKVSLIENKSEQYDEASRQLLLIAKAREVSPGPRILLALDADEILAANAAEQIGWKTMLQAKPGTVLCFEKPDLYLSPTQCIRFTIPWPLGYVDDGVEHQPKQIHSIRVPMPSYAPRLNIYDVKVLHYGLLRQQAQASKMRLYCVLENIEATLPLTSRRVMYAAGKDYAKAGRLENVQPEWLAGWEKLGIDMQSIVSQKYYWQDFEVLRHFEQRGEQRFWKDDIWNFDWEACRLFAQSCQMTGIPQKTITGPSKALAAGLPIVDRVIGSARKVKTSFFGQAGPRWL